MYKLVALDIDGTLLDPGGTIRPRVREAVRRVVAAGVIVTLATGRRHRAARYVADELGIAAPLILYSGSVIYDPPTESALLHRPLSAEFVREAVALLREAGMNPGILQSPLRGERIYLGPPEHDDDYMRDYASHPVRSDLVERRAYDDLAQVEDPLVVIATGPGQAARYLLNCIQDAGRLNCNLYGYALRSSNLSDLHGFDLLPPTHTKATALEWLAAHFGLELSETLVIGDGPNDVDMLRAAGLGVAMGNATPEVKAAADIVVGSNQEDGVAEALERFILS